MDVIVKSPKLKQRADLTYKHNTVSGRHGWLRLTPAYSVKVVEEVLPSAGEGSRVLDPFSGTATTTLCAATHGMEAVSIDVNPFLVWLGNAKLAHYSRDQLAAARAAGTRAMASACNPKGPRADAPPLFNIERWWPADRLEFLCRLKAALNAEDALDKGAHDLLSVALCRSVITLSNAAFNHQSMSFKKPTDQPGLFEELSVHAAQYEADLDHVLKSAGENPPVKGKVVEGDSRNVAAALEGRFDLVVTSPPYPNRMSYIRELRPYMYWLDYIKEAREAGELDWKAMGGTWGMATSALNTWERPVDGFSTPHFEKVLFDIAHADNKNGEVLSRYVAKYFVDMNNHLASMRTVLNPGAKLHYIVGNSTFYGTLLPVELLFEDMFRGLGFTDISHVAIRKRNSKKELFEYDVTATWPG
jgi:DNA modification methylase